MPNKGEKSKGISARTGQAPAPGAVGNVVRGRSESIVKGMKIRIYVQSSKNTHAPSPGGA